MASPSPYVFTAHFPRWPIERYLVVLLVVGSVDIAAFVALANTGTTREEARWFDEAARHPLPKQCAYVRESADSHPALLDDVFAHCAPDLIEKRAPVGLQLDVMTDDAGRACRISSNGYGDAVTRARRHDLAECARRSTLLLDGLPPNTRYTVDFRVRGSTPAANISR